MGFAGFDSEMGYAAMDPEVENFLHEGIFSWMGVNLEVRSISPGGHPHTKEMIQSRMAQDDSAYVE